MSVFDYEEAPPPPPMYQPRVRKAKVVKDKSLKDDVLYRTEFYMPSIKKWNATCLQSSLKAAKRNKRRNQESDRKKGIELKYRILKLTVKKEVVG